MRISYSPAYLLVLYFLFGCNPDQQDVQQFVRPHIIQTTGYSVLKDSLADPVVIPLPDSQLPRKPAGNPDIQPLVTNTIPAGDPPPLSSSSLPEHCTPGKNGYAVPDTFYADWQDVRVEQPDIVEAKDMDSQGDGPVSFGIFGPQQGLPHAVRQLLATRDGNLWIGSLHGLTKYDGHSFSHYFFLKTPQSISCLFEDRAGQIWVTTHSNDESDGIWVFNGKSYRRLTQARGFTDAGIQDMVEDANGNIWMATWGGGLLKYTGDAFVQFTEAHGLPSDIVRSVSLDRNGNLWIGTSKGISRYDVSQGRFGTFINYTFGDCLKCNNVHCIQEDDAGVLWLGTGNGVIKFDVQLPLTDVNRITALTQAQGLPGNNVFDIMRDHDGSFWFRTQGHGLVKYDGSTFTKFTEKHGLPKNPLTCIVQDQQSNIWVGSRKGICKYFGNVFTHYTTRQGLSDNHIRSICQDGSGDFWFATQSGGLNKFDGKAFAHYGLEQGLPALSVLSICESDDGSIWMATSAGAVKYEPPRDGTPASFAYINEDQGLPHPYTMVVTQDRIGNIWLGTGSGAAKYDGESLTLYDVPQGLTGIAVNNMYHDRDGVMWFGTVSEGVTRYDGEIFTHFTEAQGLPSNTTESILEDNAGRLWLATSNGIAQYDGHAFAIMREAQGLASTVIKSLVTDGNNNFWFGTNIGLGHFNSTAWNDYLNSDHLSTPFLIRNYSYEDGFLGTGCTTRSMYLAHDGTVWTGTLDRLTAYRPSGSDRDTVAPTIQLSGLRLYNHPFPWLEYDINKDTSFFLGNSVNIAGMRFDSLSRWNRLPCGLSLAHSNNNMTFEFVGATLSQPHKVRYQYKLDGLSDSWSSLSHVNSAPYGNLAPGHYTFRVKALGNNGRWSDELTYPFTIRPPWWKTWWAYTIYATLFIVILASLRAYEIRRLKYRSEASRLKELDSLKSKLYTNITHEFRTPLTVILGMVDNIRGFDKERGLIRRNSGKLLKLVNQMMDLSRFDSGAMKLNVKQADVISYLNYLAESFYSLAQENEIRLTFYSEEPEVIMDFDDDKLQHVIYNLLSNAIKFTQAGGKVVLHSRTTNADGRPHLQIKVQDNGKGIPEESLSEIFDRFYQVEMSMTRTGEGSGIGLALAKEYVELMGGTISVKSKLGEGSEFTILLPITREAQSAAPMIAKDSLPGVATGTAVISPDEQGSAGDTDLPILLIVEDNRDVVTYIRSIVETGYRVETAPNGRIGLEMAIESIPDVVISDVMMPEMDGYELTKQLKTDERTSHIPIILLTAKAEREDRLTGLQLGADAYLAKPFDKSELLIRLEKLTELRIALQRRYAQMHPQKSENGMPTVEDVFLKKAQEIVEEHLADAEFTVARFSRDIGMSQTQLYRKLTALTGRSPSQFVRYLRLQKASVMLKKTDLNISEVAWQTGFNDPNYFSRAFHQDFGMTPTEWRNQ